MLLEWLYCFTRTAEIRTEIDWKEEAEVAEELGFATHSFDIELLIDGRLEEAIRLLRMMTSVRNMFRF